MASFVTNKYKLASLTGLDLSSATIKVALMSASYDGTADTDSFSSTYEVTGTGYTAGGITLTSVSTTQDNANDRAIFNADDVEWDPLTTTAQYAAVYVSGGTFDQVLIAVFDNGSTVSPSAGPLTIQWDTVGLFTVSEGA